MARKDERLYGVWLNMKHRCNIPTDPAYKNYGGRGIKVCEEWDRFYEKFKEWAYSSGYDENAERFACTIDRIDVNGDYEPSNCRWVDRFCQANNTRKNIYIEWNGETHTISEWGRILGISPKKLQARIRTYGVDIDRAFSVKNNLDETILTYCGETHNLKDWSVITGIHVQTLSSRIHKLHWDAKKALTTPPRINKRNAHRYENKPSSGK